MKNKTASHRVQGNKLSILLSAAMLFLATTAEANYSPHIQNARSLVPPGATIMEAKPGTPIARQIDSAIIEILSTKTGKVLCGAVTENIEDFHRAFFVHREAAEKAFSLCKDEKENYFAKKQAHRLFEKKYIVAATSRTDFPADGWTTPRNETILFMSLSEMQRARFIRSLSHELAVSLDRKELLGWGGVVDPALLGLLTNEASCAATSVTRSVHLKHTLSAIRAFELEKRIAEELGLPLEENFASPHRSCDERILHLSKYTEGFAQAFASEDLVNQLFDIPSCQGAPLTTLSLKKRVEILMNTTLSFKDGSQRNACDYFTEGWPFYPGASFRGGPGPRVGGGGW